MRTMTTNRHWLLCRFQPKRVWTRTTRLSLEALENRIVPACPCTIWDNTATPELIDANDANAIEVGAKFRSAVDGSITGLRFYKGASNIGTHVGNLWTSTGTQLASVIFTNETASGWQQTSFAAPAPIAANTTYVASYHTSVGRYAATVNFFAGRGVDSPPLRALADGEDGANGVFVYSPTSTFPSQNSINSANYWVDVVFVPSDTIPPAVAITSPSDGAFVAGTITVSANASDNVGVAGVQFLLDGANLGAEDTVAPYAISWNTTTATNGSHNLTARARDAATNATTSSVVTVTVDNLAPAVSITNPSDGGVVAGTITVSASASDNVSVVGVQFLLDGANLGAEDTVAPYAVSWDSTTASNGSHQLTARGRDPAGNVTSAPVTVTVDNTAPTVSVTSPSDAAIVAGTITVTAAASDNATSVGVGVAGVQFLLDGANLGAEDTVAPYTISWNTTTATNGPHTLTARARDGAGNVATSSPVTVTVDNIAPTVTITSPSSGSAVGGTITVSASASDNLGVAGVQFLLDGEKLGGEDTAAPYSVSWNTTTATNGLHTLSAVARDAAGNVATSSAVTVTVDNLAPAVSITSPADGANVSGTITVSASASDNLEVAGVQFLLDGANLGVEDTVAPYSVSWNTTTTSDGVHQLTARARDVAGNSTTSTVVTVTVTNDTVAPSVSITSPANGALVAGTITVSANAADNVGVVGVQFLLDGANLGAEDTVAPYSISWNTTTATNGSHTLTARARDAAGNSTTSSVVTVTVDNAAPSVNITSPSDGAFVAGTINVSASASDNVGVVGVQFLLDGANLGSEDTVAPYAISWNTATATNGSHNLTARARDAVGNSTTFSVTVTVDNLAPSVTISSPSNLAILFGTVTVSADASDNVGVAGVQFLLDGANLGAEDTVAPYSISWDTTKTSNGLHTLTARARDLAGNQTTSGEVIVTVLNLLLEAAPSSDPVEDYIVTDASDLAGLTPALTEPLLNEAVVQWLARGLDDTQASRLDALQLHVAELPGPVLGLASGNTIVLDRDAAGYGWFVDVSPPRHEEFGQVGHEGELRAGRHSPAFGRVDLLSVLAHELGHVLGLEHTAEAEHTSEVMEAALPPGVRRLPVAQPSLTHAAPLPLRLPSELEVMGQREDRVVAGRLAVRAIGGVTPLSTRAEPAPLRVPSASDQEPGLLEEAGERPALAGRGRARTLERVERLSNQSLAVGAARSIPLADSKVLDAVFADLWDGEFWNLRGIDVDEVAQDAIAFP